jgi:hypothetical protein
VQVMCGKNGMLLSDQEACYFLFMLHYNVVNSCCLNALELTEKHTGLILYYNRQM